MIWIDAGYYYGAATDLMEPQDDWDIYAFEPNLELEIPGWVSREVLWIKDGTVKFKLNRDRNDASSINSGISDFTEVEYPCINFSRFVKQLSNDVIVCSMDIEGAEFKVLEKMLKDNTIDKITVLDVEFHHRLMNEYDDDDARDLIKRIRERGVVVMLKVPLI